MAGQCGELLVVLTGTLLLVSVLAWEQINDTQLRSLYETGRWGEARTSLDDSSDYDDYEYDNSPEEEKEKEVPGAKDDASETFDFSDYGFPVAAGESDFQVDAGDSDFQVDGGESDFQVDGGESDFEVDAGDSDSRNWADATESGFQVDFVGARTWTGSTSLNSEGLEVVCNETGFKVTLPGPLSEVGTLGSKRLLSVTDSPSCGYELNHFTNTLYVPFTACNVRSQAESFSLQLVYIDMLGQRKTSVVTCEGSDTDISSRPSPRCPSTKPSTSYTMPSKAQNCGVSVGERVPCGYRGISFSDCEKMGCCVCFAKSTCYYPLDECTADQHFVFAIRSNSASIPVDPTQLVLAGSTGCKPVIVNNRVAIFKFQVGACGTRVYEVGDLTIYLAEVQTIVQALNLKYGVVTRSDPLRFMVECRYNKRGTAQQSMASVGYMVMTPTSMLPSMVTANGLYGVQLRLAKDYTYSSFYPTCHQPLKLLLGNPVYLELSLKSLKPEAVLLVNYCLAYPRSAKNALVLVYEGCANPNDPNVSILTVGDLSNNRNKRRFVVRAFMFMEQYTNAYLDEEIYFMCSTEVCWPSEKTCDERCFDGKVL